GVQTCALPIYLLGQRDGGRVVFLLERVLDLAQLLDPVAGRPGLGLLAGGLGVQLLLLLGLAGVGLGAGGIALGAHALATDAVVLGESVRHAGREHHHRDQGHRDATEGQALAGGVHCATSSFMCSPAAARAPVEPVTLSEKPYIAHLPRRSVSHTTGGCRWPSPARRPAPSPPRGYAIRRSGRSGPGAWRAIPGAGCRPPRSCSPTGSRRRAGRSRRGP